MNRREGVSDSMIFYLFIAGLLLLLVLSRAYPSVLSDNNLSVNDSDYSYHSVNVSCMHPLFNSNDSAYYCNIDDVVVR